MRRWSRAVPLITLVTALSGGAFTAAPATANTSFTPAWYGHGHVLSGAAENLAHLLRAPTAGVSSTAGASSTMPAGCRAEHSFSGNVLVNCLREDGRSPQNTQSETSEAVIGKTVVVGYNDSRLCCKQIDFTGYSVSRDRGNTFFDMGGLPLLSHVQPIGDPAVAAGTNGSFYFASLALSGVAASSHSLISIYRIGPGQTRFHLLSVPVDVGSQANRFADKEYLAIGRDAAGHQHFYLTWTLFTSAVPSVIMLTDSTDGVHWRTHPVSSATGCSQGSNPVPAGGKVYVSWEQSVPTACAAGNPNPHAMVMMATVEAATGKLVRRTVVAPILGAGDAIVNCNGPTDFREVIETAPGRDIRLFELPTTTIDRHGVLYAAWNDRPGGVGGLPTNATRIYLSISRDGARTWSKTPAVISGPVSRTFVRDRFQPWITADTTGLHAMWYERVGSLVQTNAENLTLATPTAAPQRGPEVMVSSVAFPVVRTNPNQDPVISNCYMGDYNNIVTSAGEQYISWGDNRNVVQTTHGVEHQPDVFFSRR